MPLACDSLQVAPWIGGDPLSSIRVRDQSAGRPAPNPRCERRSERCAGRGPWVPAIPLGASRSRRAQRSDRRVQRPGRRRVGSGGGPSGGGSGHGGGRCGHRPHSPGAEGLRRPALRHQRQAGPGTGDPGSAGRIRRGGRSAGAAAPAHRLGRGPGLRCGRGSRGGGLARRGSHRRAALCGGCRTGRRSAVSPGRTARPGSRSLPRGWREGRGAGASHLRPAGLRHRGERRGGGLRGRRGAGPSAHLRRPGRGDRLTSRPGAARTRLRGSRRYRPAPICGSGGWARSSRRTRTSTGWTRPWSSRASTRTTGS